MQSVFFFVVSGARQFSTSLEIHHIWNKLHTKTSGSYRILYVSLLSLCDLVVVVIVIIYLYILSEHLYVGMERILLCFRITFNIGIKWSAALPDLLQFTECAWMDGINRCIQYIKLLYIYEFMRLSTYTLNGKLYRWRFLDIVWNCLSLLISWLLDMQEKNSISRYIWNVSKYQYKQQRKTQLLPQSRSSIYNSILLNVSPKHILLICICQPVLTMKSRA